MLAGALGCMGLISLGREAEFGSDAAAPLVNGAVVGCVDLDAHGTCLFEPGSELTVWASSGLGQRPELWVDGLRQRVPVERLASGFRWRVAAESSWRTIFARGTTGTAAFALAPVPELSAEVLAARALADAGQSEDAAEAVNALVANSHGLDRVEAFELKGDLAFGDGDPRAAIDAYAQGARAGASLGRKRRASTMAQRIVYACTALDRDEACVKRWLELDAAWSEGDAEQAVLHDYYRALFDAQIGDRRAAEDGFASVIERADAFGLDTLRASASTEAMLSAAEVGDWTSAERHRAQAQAMVESMPDPLRAQVHNAIGWMLLLAHARGRTDLPRPTQALHEALELAGGDDAVSRRLRATLRLNLAYDALLSDDLARAEQWLERSASGAWLHDDERTWSTLLRARVLAGRGKTAAAARGFLAVAEEARVSDEPELAWQAHVGLAEVLALDGRISEALAHYEQAALILERELPKIALGAGRSRYLAERARGARQHVRLLLNARRPADALCVARLARSRHFPRPRSESARRQNGLARAAGVQRRACEARTRARRRVESAPSRGECSLRISPG